MLTAVLPLSARQEQSALTVVPLVLSLACTAIQAPTAGTDSFTWLAPLPRVTVIPGSCALSCEALSALNAHWVEVRKLAMSGNWVAPPPPACAVTHAALLAVVDSAAERAVNSGVANRFWLVPESTNASAVLAVGVPDGPAKTLVSGTFQ